MIDQKLKEILFDFFTKVENNQEKLLKEIKNNIENEEDLSSPNIYIGIENEEDIPKGFSPIGNYLSFNKEFPYSLFSIYINEKYSKILELILENKIYRGWFIDKYNKKYQFEYKLLQNKSFIEEEREMENFLFENNISYKPIFNPYSRKILNVKIINPLDNIDNLEVEEINLGDLEKEIKIKKDYIPIWNVQIKNDEIIQLSVVPDENKKLFCIETSTQDNVIELFKSKETLIDHTVKTKDSIKIYFNKEIKRWDSCKIFNTYIENEENYYLNNTFDTDNLKKFGTYMPKTKFEIERRVCSIANKLDLKYKGYSLENTTPKKEIEKYTQDFGYLKNLKVNFLTFSQKRKNIYLELEETNDILFEDKVNFLLAYMTFIYPEINWIGVCKNE